MNSCMQRPCELFVLPDNKILEEVMGHHSLYCTTSLAQELWLHLLLSSSNASRSMVDWLCHEHSTSDLPLPAPQMRFLMTVRPKGRDAMHACIRRTSKTVKRAREGMRKMSSRRNQTHDIEAKTKVSTSICRGAK
ncbi:hypothetical protein Droror1_Dr00005305 [Drosera rotundifolia]